MDLEKIAAVAHEANRAYCQTIGDNSQPPWSSAPPWQRDSAIQGVRFVLENPNAGDSAQHDNWVRVKVAEGWVYGPEKDPEKKTLGAVRQAAEGAAGQGPPVSRRRDGPGLEGGIRGLATCGQYAAAGRAKPPNRNSPGSWNAAG